MTSNQPNVCPWCSRPISVLTRRQSAQTILQCKPCRAVWWAIEVEGDKLPSLPLSPEGITWGDEIIAQYSIIAREAKI